MPDAFVQVAPDSSGKRMAMSNAVLRAGTNVFNSDGTVTTLTSDTQVFIEKVVLADERGMVFNQIQDTEWQQLVLNKLDRIRRGLEIFIGQLIPEEDTDS